MGWRRPQPGQEQGGLLGQAGLPRGAARGLAHGLGSLLWLGQLPSPAAALSPGTCPLWDFPAAHSYGFSTEHSNGAQITSLEENGSAQTPLEGTQGLAF